MKRVWVCFTLSMVSSLVLFAQTMGAQAGAASIAYCHSSGTGGLGTSNRTDVSPEENRANANLKAVENCVAGGGKHGCCKVRVKTSYPSGKKCVALVTNPEKDFDVGQGRTKQEAVANAKSACGGYCNPIASACAKATQQIVKPVPEQRREPEPTRNVCEVYDVRPPDDWLALRSRASSRSGRQIRKLWRGQRFEMLGRRKGSWYLVALPDGTRGWVSWAKSRWIRC